MDILMMVMSLVWLRLLFGYTQRHAYGAVHAHGGPEAWIMVQADLRLRLCLQSHMVLVPVILMLAYAAWAPSSATIHLVAYVLASVTVWHVVARVMTGVLAGMIYRKVVPRDQRKKIRFF